MRNTYTIPREKVDAYLVTLDDYAAELIAWLDAFARKRDLSFEEIGRMMPQPSGIPYSADSIYQLMTGRRGAEKIDAYLEAIRILRAVETERSGLKRAGFVETSMVKRVWKVCDLSRKFQRMQFIVGPFQVGKTRALEEYAHRHNHGSTHYLRLPAGASLSDTLRRLARTVGVSIKGGLPQLRERILGRFTENMVLIVDEAHQMTLGKTGMNTLEFLRELHDMTRCGVVFAFSYLDRDRLDTRSKQLMRQAALRRFAWVELDPVPSRRDLAKFADYFGLPPAKDAALDLQTAVIEEDGLGRWLAILEGAGALAQGKGEEMAWAHVLASYDELRRLEGGR